jgi:energy-coupling factor transporter ATP-binding protein EcfA2
VKITKIEVCDFRGFKGPAVYDFAFGNARNLLIYGENGSGKSSLFSAIREFFNHGGQTKGFEAFRNINPPLFDAGHVTVHFDDGASQAWTFGSPRPLKSVPASQTALQVGCLDYRSLLETNFSQKGNTVNLFEIAVNHLVSDLEVPVGGSSARIGDLWRTVLRRKPPSHHKRYLLECQQALDRFNAAFAPEVPRLVDEATELLSRFPGCADYSLGLAFQPVEYPNGWHREFKNCELILSVHRNGILLTDHHNFLNEARLSAIGLVIYLAGLLITVPTTSTYPKLLILDDVLVGLDMANRGPVLRILAEYFADWQIILLTHDKVWYEMVQVEIDTGNFGRAYEIWLAMDGATPVHRSRDGGADFFLSRAKSHLAANDDRAAAVYARAAFEAKIKAHCDKRSVPVPYSRDPKRIDADTFWKAATKHAIEKAGTPAEKAALEPGFQAIEVAKKIVLNPLSHAITQSVTKPEIQAAIDAVMNLNFGGHLAAAPPGP